MYEMNLFYYGDDVEDPEHIEELGFVDDDALLDFFQSRICPRGQSCSRIYDTGHCHATEPEYLSCRDDGGLEDEHELFTTGEIDTDDLWFADNTDYFVRVQRVS